MTEKKSNMYGISNSDIRRKIKLERKMGSARNVRFKNSVAREGLTEVTLGGRPRVGEGVIKCSHGGKRSTQSKF